MELGLAEILIGGICGVVGGFLGKGHDWLKTRSDTRVKEKQVDSQVQTTEIEKAAVIYRELIADLRAEVDELALLLKELEEERLDCRTENAKLKAEYKALQQNYAELKTKLDIS